MRRFALTALILSGLFALIAFLLWWWPSPIPTADAPAPPSARATSAEAGLASAPAPSAPPPTRNFIATEANSRRAESAPGGVVVVPDIAAQARQLHAPEQSAQEDLQILESLLAFYRRANGGANPGGGLNEEFVRELRGDNPNKLAVLPPGLPSIDAQGQLLDRWGTPYFFHPVSRTVLEIRTAGPDRKLWTEDDVQAGTAPEELSARLGTK